MELHAGIIEMNFHCKINISEKYTKMKMLIEKTVKHHYLELNATKYSLMDCDFKNPIKNSVQDNQPILIYHCTSVLKILMFMIWKDNCIFNVPG